MAAKSETRRVIKRAEQAVEQTPVHEFAERAYLNYSMYVILDRALPYLGDGLKPVQRRIVYAMSELGLSATAKPKKSARTIGDVLGKYHPHGDTACYEAMVLMAQPFAFRYPLIQGQGNWGSADDPRSFAAMRYTESRLTPYSETLLAELGQGTVGWRPNFDGTLHEPKILPARLPNVLLNGATGIAVGMATDVPPHNMNEIVAACVELLTSPKAKAAEVLAHVQGPDYPGGGEIVSPPDEIRRIYETGAGMLRARASYELEQGRIVITSLPFRVSGNRVLAQIAAQMQSGKRSLIADLHDESDQSHPVRIVIVPQSRRVDADALMSHLFACTDLEHNHRVNFNVIDLQGRPRVMSLVQILREWLEFRTETVRRRLRWRLQKIAERLEILEGLLTVHLNLDEVIRIVRRENDPEHELIKRFGLSLNQARAILEMRLKQLHRIEKIKVETERDGLASERDELDRCLSSARRLKTLVKKELLRDAGTHGDERRTQLVVRPEAKTMELVQPVVSEPVTVVLSDKGWVRALKGHDTDPREQEYRTGDGFLDAARGRSGDTVFFFDSSGHCYCAPGRALPSGRERSEPLSSRFSPPEDARFVAVATGADADRCLLASSFGYGFVAEFKSLVTRLKSGKQVMSLPVGAVLEKVVKVEAGASAFILLTTSENYMLMVDAAEMPLRARGRGNKIINIPKPLLAEGRERLAHVVCIAQGDTVVLHAGRRTRKMKFDELRDYLGARARRGRKLPRGWRNLSRLERYTPPGKTGAGATA